MKRTVLLMLLLLPVKLLAGSVDAEARNIFLLTLDGLRWQEVFRGLDESLAGNRKYNERLVTTGDECLTSNRIAATLLKLLGEKYELFNPDMGPPMQEFLK
ncbi:MAG: hypothetical protein QGD92_03325 [Gammaproteobacteria bacterium]|nr:hypothetical protein [Gammaproteobacteria bacterium]